MKSLLRFAAVSLLALGFVVSTPAADAATKKPKKKVCTEACCKDGNCAETAKKGGKCDACCDDAKKT